MTEPEALARLQEIDIALMRCTSTLEKLPQRSKVATIRTARRKVATELTKIVGQRKDLEMEISDNAKERASFEAKVTEAQVAAAEGSSEYRKAKDLEEHLSFLAKRLEKLSFEDEGFTEQLEKLERAEKNARGVDARLVVEEEAQTASFKADAASVKEEMDGLQEERARVSQDLSQELLDRYAKAMKRFHGIAVERLQGNKPSACRVTIQPSQLGDLRHGPVITECPYCHRMLITEAE